MVMKRKPGDDKKKKKEKKDRGITIGPKVWRKRTVKRRGSGPKRVRERMVFGTTKPYNNFFFFVFFF